MAELGTNTATNTNFLTIASAFTKSGELKTDNRTGNPIKGLLRQKVQSDTLNAEEIVFTTDSGEEIKKYEVGYPNLTGKITGIRFHDGKFGENLLLEIEDYTIQIQYGSDYFTDLAKRLPNVDLTKDITLAPYNFVDENTNKRVKVLTLNQEGEKLGNFFFDGKKVLHGFPEPDFDTKKATKDDWKIHFIKVNKFLKEYINQKILIPTSNVNSPKDKPVEDMGVDDLPF